MTQRLQAAELPDSIVRLMAAPDRKALGLALPEEAAARADAQQERELQRQCEAWLSLHGVEYLHLSPRAREKAGWPDLTFAIGGVPYAVELKTATSKLSDDQRRVLGRMAANGWRCIVARSLPEMIEALERKEHQPCETNGP